MGKNILDRYRRIILVGVVGVGLVIFSPASYAQQPEALTPVECFDLYKFGSVKVSISPELPATLSGAKARFYLSVSNENEYPIVDGSIYVKIFQKQANPQNAQRNGGFLVDQFFAKEGVTLDVKESKKLDFLWTVPVWLQEGDYYALTYFQSAKKLNLQGLTFTDDAAGGQTNFKVNSQFKKGVGFDRNNIKINDKAFIFINPPPRFPKDGGVTVKIPVQNLTAEKQISIITYELYFWDGAVGSQKIETKQESVELGPGETKVVSYTTSNNQYPVYYLVAKAKWRDVYSILDIRFVREGLGRARVNFEGVTKFPLKKGESNTLFACVHNTAPDDAASLYETATYAGGEGDAIVESTVKGKLELSLLDKDGGVLKKYSYVGGITGEVMGFKADFVPEKDSDNFRIKAALFDEQDKVVDEVILKYGCEDINQTKCLASSGINGSQSTSTLPSGGGKFSLTYAYLLFGFLVVVAVTVIITKKKRGEATYDSDSSNPPPGGPTTGMTTMILLVFASTILIFGIIGPNYAEARSTQFTYLYNGDLYVLKGAVLYKAIKDPYYAITYNAQATSSAGVVLNDGDQVLIGSKITFSYNPKDFQLTGSDTAYWIGTGNTYDTPYGHWKALGVYPYSSTLTCSAYDYFLTVGSLSLYRPFSVNPPTITIDTAAAQAAGTLGGCAGAGPTRTCTVTATGTINAVIKFGPTYAYQYSNINGPAGCQYRDRLKINAATDFKLDVPERAINFQFRAVSGAAGPPTLSAPIVNGPISGRVNTNYPFSAFSASTGITGNIRYGFDWDNNGSVDFWTLYQNYLVSGIGSRSWLAVGAYTFKVRAQDQDNALVSGWTSHTIDIASASAGLSLDPPIITGPPSGRPGVSYTFTARSNSTGITTGNIRYGFDWNNDNTVDIWTAPVSSSTPANSSNFWPTTGVKTFKVKAEESGGTQSGWSSFSISIGVDTLDPPIISGPSSGRTGVTYTFMAQSSSTGVNSIRYGFDWGNGSGGPPDGTVDSWTSFVSYQTPGSDSFAWGTVGPKTFNVKAQDMDLLESGWSSFSISIQDSASCSVSEFWTPCSATCGGGTQDKVRLTTTCTIELLETRACNIRSCGTIIIEVPPGGGP